MGANRFAGGRVQGVCNPKIHCTSRTRGGKEKRRNKTIFFWNKMLRTRKTIMACVVPTCYKTRVKKKKGKPPVPGYCMKPNAWIMYMIAMSGSGKTREEISAGYRESQRAWLEQNPGLTRNQQKERMNTEMCEVIAGWSRRQPRLRERANVNDATRNERRRKARERVANEKKKASEDSRKKREVSAVRKRRSEQEKADKAATKKSKELQAAERAAREKRREKDKADRATEAKQKELERAQRIAAKKQKEVENKAAKVIQKTLAVRIAKKKQKALKDKALAKKESEERKKKLEVANNATKKKQQELQDAEKATTKKQMELEQANRAAKKKQKEVHDANNAAKKKQKELDDAKRAAKKTQDAHNAATKIQKALRKKADEIRSRGKGKQRVSQFFAERPVPQGWSTEKAIANITYGFQVTYKDNKKINYTCVGGIREDDVESLLPGNWYFDSAIDKYTELLQTLSAKTHKCVFLDTVFYQRLMATDKRRRSWKDRDVNNISFFTYDLDTTHPHAKIFIPVITNRNHFVLLFVDNHKHMVYSLDSGGCGRKTQRRHILEWVEHEHREKNAPFKKEEWNTEEMVCPQQENKFDCGPFVCLFIAFLSHNKPLNFTQDDIPKMRERINWSLLNSRLETRGEIRETLQQRRKKRSSLLKSESDTRAALVRRKSRKARLAALLKERKQASRMRRLRLNNT